MKKMLACTLLQALTLSQIGLAEEKSMTDKVGEKIEEMTPDALKAEQAKKDELQAPSNLKVETVAFTSGSTQITDEEKARLKAFFESAVAAGTIKDIKLAAWSDNDIPTDPLKSLSKEDRRIADQRGEHVRTYLREQLKLKKVEVYNMAHGTNRLAKAFRTEEAEMREAFASKEKAPAKLRPEVMAIRDNGKPSHVVVVVEYKELKAK